MSLSLRLLGTSASRPTVERNVSSVAVVREGETLLFDCGEGTQRQMMRYGVAFSLEDIFFTHFHADHLIGLIGLTRTMALQGRTEPLRLWGPKGASRVLRAAERFGADRLTFDVPITELDPGTAVKRDGYAIVEEERRGRFNPDLARSLGIPEGPLWGRIHRGETITLDDGRTIEASVLVGERRRGRRLVITGDTRPSPQTIEMARDADVLVHEATFGEEEAERAIETGHSTAREAATVAAAAQVRRLVLTHFSARYSRDPGDLEREARAVFANITIARDGMEIEIPFEAETPVSSS